MVAAFLANAQFWCEASGCGWYARHQRAGGGDDGAETMGACVNATTTTAAAGMNTPCEWRCANLSQSAFVSRLAWSTDSACSTDNLSTGTNSSLSSA